MKEANDRLSVSLVRGPDLAAPHRGVGLLPGQGPTRSFI